MPVHDAGDAWRLATTRTHLYPGARLVACDGRDVPPCGSVLAIEFADGAVTSGRVATATDTSAVVELAPYRTARGTAIARKLWTLGRKNAVSLEWKVLAKGAANGGSRCENRTVVSMRSGLTLLPARTPGSAIAMIVVAMACFSVSDALAKYLTGFLPVAVIVWIRYLAFVVTLSPLLRRGPVILRTKRPWLHLVRAIALALSAAFFILALRVLPMAEATALVFASPLFVTLLSAWLLRERADRVQWVIVMVGFAGVLAVMRPGTAAFYPGALLPVCSSIAWAVSVICTRKLTVHDGVDTTLVYSGLIGFVLLTVIALPQIVVPPPGAIAAAIGMAVVWSAAQWLSVHAYHRGSVAVLAPFSYSQLMWSTLIGVIVFRHVPDAATFIGIVTILACGVVAVWWSTRDAAEPERPG